MDEIGCLVVGAGVVGLAVARALARAGHEVVVLESAATFGTGVSSRSSEVIHAGLYYPTGSLKARLCVQGRRMLYRYCAERGVAHRRCGKLVVAGGEAGVAKLQAIAARAQANGVEGLQWLDGAQARKREPALACDAALWSPESGIVDSHALMTALLGDAEAAGAVLARASPFVRAVRDAPAGGAGHAGDGWVVDVGGAEPSRVRARWLVNCAGLRAQAVARAVQGHPAAAVPPVWRAKGRYFTLAGRAPFSHLIYPTPEDGGLGVHLTLDLGGQARFGPDVQWLPPPPPGAVEAPDDPDTLDYTVDPALAPAFEAAVRRWWPGLPAGALQPAYAGVRPKLAGPGAADADFVIAGLAEHGLPGLVNLYGIESPGLTACLALADEVAARVGRDG
jgi:L-2-hydroxyglutarate oxidase LhgO